MGAPRQIVSPPAGDPSPYGLLSVAQFPPAGDVHWLNGITWQSACVTGLGSTTYDECVSVEVTGAGSVPAPPARVPTTYLTEYGATPFTAEVLFECSPVGNDQAQRLAEEALATTGSWQVERAFWTGIAGGQAVVFPHLADDQAKTSVTDGAVLQSVPVTGGSATYDMAEALGFLEKQIANCSNKLGVIHVPVEALPTLDAWGLVKVTGQVLRTLNGNRVAVGAGYSGTSPGGAAPAAGTTWMYATGPVFGYAGTVRVSNSREALDRTENTLRMVAQRTYVLGWDCCHAGVLVKLGVPYSGTDTG